MSRKVEMWTPDPKVGGSNPLRHAIHPAHITLEIRDLSPVLEAYTFCPCFHVIYSS
jgi:hypothetical protein